MYDNIIPSDEYVKKFKQSMKKEYGEDYSDEDARESAYNLLNFFNLLLKVDMRMKLRRGFIILLKNIIEKKLL